MKCDNQTGITRRNVILSGAGIALGSVLPAGKSAEGTENAGVAGANVYEAIGVKPFINATGTMTHFGGSLMPPEVIAAWVEASRHFIDMFDLHDKVGQRIAHLIGVEAAMVTTGASGAMQLGIAAAVTRGEKKRVLQLPDTSDLKSEIIMQTTHHTCYDNQLRNSGMKLVDVETRADLEKAIGDQTAVMFFLNLADPDGQLKRKEWVEVAKERNIPTLLDAAADVPPIGRLSEYTDMGFDMVAFSGGKALMGPNDTGLLLGRRDLIEAAKKNTNPVCGSIGRMMKVSKEDMIALLAAVERYIKVDHEAEWREWERRLEVIENAVKGIPTIKVERFVPPIANVVPHTILTWDETKVRINRDQISDQLMAGNPGIAFGRVRGTGDKGLLISVFMLKEGEDRVVGERLREALETAIA